jgi:hypothetical protein
MTICKKGIARFLIFVLLAVLALGAFAAPVHAGVSPEVGKSVGNGGVVIIGETTISFSNDDGFVIPYGTIRSTNDDPDILVTITFNGPFDSSEYKDDLSKTDEYVVTGPNGRITVYFFAPELRVKTKVCGEDFLWVKKGDNITFEADTNLWFISNVSKDFSILEGPLPNNITYKLLGPDEVQVYDINGVSLRDIDVGFDYKGKNSTTINTARLDIGIYKLRIETDPETNNGLDTEGPEIYFKIKSEGVTIEVEPKEKEQATYEELVFTLSTTPYTNVSLEITWGVDVNVEFIEGRGDVVRGGTTAFGTSDRNGDFKAVAYFPVSGFYKITATEYGCSGEVKPSTRENSTNSTEVKIVPFKPELKVDKDVPIYHIGEDVEITGNANTGDNITLKIEDEEVKTDLNIKGFHYTWPTKEKSPGSYRIAIWILPLSDPAQDPPDKSISVVLIRGGLFAEPSAQFVALGDGFTIEGVVPGRDRVDIFTIAPEGGGGGGFSAKKGGVLDAPGLTYGAYGVDTEGKFETEEIKVDEDVDTGTYLILALNYGRDGEWGISRESDLLRAISNDYTTPLGVKTTDQILAIVKDRTIDAPGTDDLLGLTTIKVEPGFVTVDPLADVPLGGEITVTGTTNRQENTSITITVEGTDERTPSLKPKITKVEENEKIYYNSFEATFATKSANIGEYIVTVDDSDRHTASTSLTIVPAVEPAVNVSAPRPSPSGGAEVNESVAETPVPTPTTQPTNPPTEPPVMESTAMPGFLSLWIILMILWLVIAIIIAVWVYRDATEHGQNGVLWVIIVLILSVVGLLIWLVKRPKTKE